MEGVVQKLANVHMAVIKPEGAYEWNNCMLENAMPFHTVSCESSVDKIAVVCCASRESHKASAVDIPVLPGAYKHSRMSSQIKITHGRLCRISHLCIYFPFRR